MTHTAARAGRHLISACLFSTLALAAYAPRAIAQTETTDTRPASAQEYRTFYLGNTMTETQNDIVTDLRNMLPRAKVYRVESQGAISILGTADELQLAQRIIADIDRPAKTYRLTFTIKENDAGKPDDPRHVAVVVALGNKSEVKQGTKVPIVTGSTDVQSSGTNTQVQYLDVGLSIDVWLDGSGNGLRLHTKVAESSVADEKSNVGIQDPILRQTVLDGQASLVEGKPTVLGTLEMPGGTGSEEIQVVAEAVK
jgi:type II secretory pathway component GspD/PulD (secretin)